MIDKNIFGDISNPKAFIQLYIDLWFSGDIDRCLALHTDDTEFVIPGENILRGKEALRMLVYRDRALGGELTLRDIKVEGDAIIIDTAMERNKWLQGLGISEIHYKKPAVRVVFRGGRIQGTYLNEFIAEDARNLDAQFKRLQNWLSTQRPGDLEYLQAKDQPLFDPERLKLWLEVMEDWNESKKLW